MSAARDALRELLERPALARLWAAARSRLERRGAGEDGEIELGGMTARVDDPTDAERAAAADLLALAKLPSAGRPLQVRLAKLDAALRGSRFAVGLVEALTLHGGALRDLPAERADIAAGRLESARRARRHPLLVERPELRPWLDELFAGGLLHRLGRGDAEGLLARVLAVLAALPAEGERLAVLANRILGNSHALDTGHRVPALVLRALAALAGSPPPTSAAERRALWDSAAVVCDDLSCDVLVLGLRPTGNSLLADTLRRFADGGEPLRVTLRQLERRALAWQGAELRVAVCENPAVVAVAADRLGASCPPLICLEGFPSTAARRLLESLAAAGGRFLYHGDFDWGGLRIANALGRIVPWAPWRFTTHDYQARVAERGDDPLPLESDPVDAEWDAELRPAMEAAGVKVEEEAGVDELVGDLGQTNGPSSGRAAPRG